MDSSNTATSSRESHLAEVCLEYVFGRPYGELVDLARATNACDEVDLLLLGRTILRDIVRLMRGDASAVLIPDRLPHRGEYDLSGGPR